MWNGQFDVLNAYGSEFAAGEGFNWLIWDASTNTYHEADAVYDESYDDTDQFAIGGESAILDLVTRELFVQQIDLERT